MKQLQADIRLIQDGDLSVEINTKRKDEVGSLARVFQSMIGKMSSMISNIRENSEEVIKEVDLLNQSVDMTNKATEEITRIVSGIALGASEQLESVQEVETAMERVFTEIETITNNIAFVNQDSDIAMNEMKEAFDKLYHSVEQINMVNDTVDKTAYVMKNLEEKFKEVLVFSDLVAAYPSRQIY